MRTLMIASFLLLLPLQLPACPGCGGVSGQTLLGEFNSADLIVVGVLKNAVRNLDDPSQNRTELHISSVVKDHPFLKGKTVLLLPKHLPPDKSNPDAKIMVFCGLNPKVKDVANAGLVGGLGLMNFDNYTLDPYRGDPVGKDTRLADYIKGALAVQQKPIRERLEYFFPFLTDTDLKINGDAFLEYANADYKDVRDACAKLPMDEIARRLTDPNTPASHIGLYSLMLGHSGRKTDATTIRRLLDDPKKLYTSGLDGLLISYVLLDADAGWAYILKEIRDAAQTFQVRFACVHTLKFFQDFRPDAISEVKRLDAYKAIIAQPEIADMAIDDLRKRGIESLAAEILATGKSEAHLKQSFAKKALLRYLVSHSQNADAAGLLAELKGKYPDGVRAAEDAIALERDAKK